MTGDGDLRAVAALIGDPTRVCILTALLGGPALTAGALAAHAGVAPSTASEHLSRLLDGGLVAVDPEGRRRYYRLASPAVAQVLEGLAALAPPGGVTSLRQANYRQCLRAARTCYDHLAGQLGVGLCDALVGDGTLELGQDLDGAATLHLAAGGGARLVRLGVDADLDRGGRRPLVRSCIDWTEGRPHVAGVLGAGLLQRFFHAGWLVRTQGRAVRVTDAGRAGLEREFSGLGAFLPA